MPLLQLGQINDAPLPSTSLPTVAPHHWSATDSDGIQYGTTQLIDDIAKAVIEKKITGASLSGYDDGINESIDKALTSLRTDAKFESQRKTWLREWDAAYQKDPNVNLSDLIYNAVKDFVKGLTRGSIIDTVYMDPTAELDETLAAQIDIIMAKLKDDVKTKMHITLKAGDMDAELQTVLDYFNLDLADDYPDVKNFKDLEQTAKAELDNIFETSHRSTDHRPYRDGFDSIKASEGVKAEFEKLYHDSSWVNKLAMAAEQKAKDELHGILGKANSNDLDSRTLEAIDQFMKWTNAQSPKPVTPPELFGVLLGKTAGPEFLAWITKWNNIIVVSHHEDIIKASGANPERVKITIGISLKDGSTIIPEVPATTTTTGYPAYKINYGILHTLDRDTKELTDFTDTLDVKTSSYTTDQIFGVIKSMISNILPNSALNQDNFLGYLKDNGFDVKTLANGQEFKALTVADIMKINPEIFSGLDAKVTAIIEASKLEEYAKLDPSYVSQLAVTFDIKYVVDKKGLEKLYITPHIEDTAISGFKSIKIKDPTIPPETVKQLADIFKAIDLEHEKVNIPNDFTKAQRITSPLDAEATKIWNALKGTLNIPYIDEYQGKLQVGEEVPLDFIKGLFPSANKVLGEFGDSKFRYGIKFIIAKLANGDQGMVINYVITDSQDGIDTKVDNKVDNHPLEIDNIMFNVFKNRAEQHLENLKNTKKGDIPRFDIKVGVDTFAKTQTHLDQADFDAFFLEYADIVSQAKADHGVIITPGDVTYDSSDGRLYQHFDAEYTFGSTPLKASIDIPVSERFLEQTEIEDAKDHIKSQGDAAKKEISKSILTKDQKADGNQYIDETVEALQQYIDSKDPNIHQGTVDDANAVSDNFLSDVADMEKLAFAEQIQDGLLKHFNGKVPDEILKLVPGNEKAFMQIIKEHPELLDDIDNLKKILQQFGDGINLDDVAGAITSLRKGSKWFLLGLGSLLGLGGLLGGANAVKVATTNGKAASSTGKIKSSKKLAIISALIGVTSLAGSIGTFLYLFISQGGL